MEFRLMARGLRAKPTPWLLNTPRIQQPILSTLRYNSSSSTPKPDTKQAKPTETPTEASTTTTSPKAQDSKSAASDFNEILNKLDLGARTQPAEPNRGLQTRRIADVIAGTTWSSSSRESGLAGRKTDMKLGPSLGRQIHVEPERGIDLASAIRMLEATCSRNGVKHQANAQRFHVRKGMERKIKRRMRWRKLFKFSFNETVKKIQRMQAQGW
ncbi:hypothetical protein N7478_007048 [Penicillium angulare]|uniref:uncharacterized protein n=1 Tax=Penicillium angulare TaxID=116970 RepID=UPI002540FFF7|nr:uncharacterized protein N7478_007048 [Penicillium angulare]KAJ5281676.1 hypothetical protein N7478_007048 [Penicillium angulare]